jgi:hypothetical protein
METCDCDRDEKAITRTIKTEHDIELMIKEKSMPSRSLQFQLSGFYKAENDHFEKKFNSYINACGCDTGSYFTLLGFLISGLLFFTGNLQFSWSGVGYAALIVIGSAFLGKTSGMIAARILFFHLLRQVLNMVRMRRSNRPLSAM